MNGSAPGAALPTPSPPQKNRALPWVLGGCGCLFLIGLFIATIAGVVAYRIANPTPSEASTAQGSIPAGWTTFVNSRAKLTESFRDHFVSFSLSYPADRFKPSSDSLNFIVIANDLYLPDQSYFTLESISISYLSAPPGLSTQEDQDRTYPEVLTAISKKLSHELPNYQEFAQMTDHVGGLRARALLFQSVFKSTKKGDIKFYGKIIAVRQPGQPRGLTLVMIGTSLTPDIRSPADVGVKGDLGLMLQTFKITE